MYEGIIAGDPKLRTLRAIITNWASEFVQTAKAETSKRREVKTSAEY
jgi:hypothetical protein